MCSPTIGTTMLFIHGIFGDVNTVWGVTAGCGDTYASGFWLGLFLFYDGQWAFGRSHALVAPAIGQRSVFFS